ncbi:MAG: hypothetical protein ABEJ26_10355 [Halosimplex sp.]
MTEHSQRRRDGDARRYRTIEYASGDVTVTIIQDSENDRAWIQSDRTLEVET